MVSRGKQRGPDAFGGEVPPQPAPPQGHHANVLPSLPPCHRPAGQALVPTLLRSCRAALGPASPRSWPGPVRSMRPGQRTTQHSPGLAQAGQPGPVGRTGRPVRPGRCRCPSHSCRSRPAGHGAPQRHGRHGTAVRHSHTPQPSGPGTRTATGRLNSNRDATHSTKDHTQPEARTKIAGRHAASQRAEPRRGGGGPGESSWRRVLRSRVLAAPGFWSSGQ
jgi:hypothetical protein